MFFFPAALTKNGMAPQLIALIELYTPQIHSSTSSSASVLPSAVKASIINLMEKTCLVIREMSIHNDNRSEMSSAFENGKFFIKQGNFVANLILLIKEYESYPVLASNALLAMKALVTTNEAVQIISLHGTIDILGKILSSYQKSIMDLVNHSSKGGNTISSELPLPPPPPSSSTVEKSSTAEVVETANEDDEEEKELDEMNENMNNSSLLSSSISSPISADSSSHNLLLLRAVIALIRNIIADDKKKEQFVMNGSLQSLLLIFLYSQKVSTLPNMSNNNSAWNIMNDYFLMEHLFGCFAQFTLRAPKNSLILMDYQNQNSYSSFLPLLIFYLTKYAQQDSFHRQVCLMLHNIINRCPEYKRVFLDYHIEEYIQNISSRLNSVKDEAYTLLRDLGINIQYMKVDETTGKLVPVYEMFGNPTEIVGSKTGKKLNFNPVFDETSDMADRVEEEAHAPFPLEPSHSHKPRFDEEMEQTSGHDHKHEHQHEEHDHSHHHQAGDSCCDSDHHDHSDSLTQAKAEEHEHVHEENCHHHCEGHGSDEHDHREHHH
jgi:hypothetical protein